MIKFLFWLAGLLVSRLRQRQELALENLALRQQLAILKRSQPRPKLGCRDRLFWTGLYPTWGKWQHALVLVKPETVVKWHREGLRLYWKWISRRKSPGRPLVSREIRDLIRQMVQANPLWGAPRIHGELLKLGIQVSERTLSRLMPRPRKPPSQTWSTFLHNHVNELVSVDFFTVPTATFRVLFVFVVLSHQRRRVLHCNITPHPTALWTAQQITEAFPEVTVPRYLLRDRDQVYGESFRDRAQAMNLTEVLTAPQSPWQSPLVERLIGSVRRECLDHLIVLGERHLRYILKSYFQYYHQSRTHLSLEKDSPEPRLTQPPEAGNVTELPCVGGLHHRYERRAA